uniref:Peptidase S1 domain-containing protein n=1 Tax=Xiphophorus couchianus TaxID=32473 RepID=A0A3B5M249_9TELE
CSPSSICTWSLPESLSGVQAPGDSFRLNTLQRNRQSRIIGGQDASPGSWPWHVAFTTDNNNLFCQGSLITKEWVLTAAKCERLGLWKHISANSQPYFYI